MKLKFLKCCVRSLLAILVISCSGGGGNDSLSTGSAESDDSSGVRLLHGAIDSYPYDIYSSKIPDTAIYTQKFGLPSYRRALPKGDQTLTITKTKSPTDVFFSFPISAGKKVKNTVLIYGNSTTLGIRSALFVDDSGEVTKLESKARFIHGLVGAAELNVSIDGVDIVTQLGYGNASTYLTIVPGVHTLTIKRRADLKVVYSGAVTFDPKLAYTFLATGEVNYLVVVPQYID